MNVFRFLLGLITVSIIAYTLLTIVNHGWNLFLIFFSDLVAMTWPGQFNFDFTCFLVLSGLWIAWRHQFSPLGLVLGLIATVGGMMFVAPYLLLATFRANGNMETLLLGEQRIIQ
ncbi:MAG: hypothetical protein AAF703_15935 [Cyanobacteria bacterium P01_D01_bin.105]